MFCKFKNIRMYKVTSNDPVDFICWFINFPNPKLEMKLN